MIGVNHSVLRTFAIENRGYDENMLGPAYYEDADFTCRLRERFSSTLYLLQARS